MSDKYKEIRKLIRESLAEEINELTTQPLASQTRDGLRGSFRSSFQKRAIDNTTSTEPKEDEGPNQLFDISVDDAKYLNKLEGRDLFSIILSDRIRTSISDYRLYLKKVASTYENSSALTAGTKLKIKKAIKFLLDNNIGSIEQYDELIKANEQASSDKSMEEKILLLLNKKVNIEGKEFSVAGVLAMAAATKNFAPSLRLENARSDTKRDTREAKAYQVVAAIANNIRIVETGREISIAEKGTEEIKAGQLHELVREASIEKLRELTVEVKSDFNFKVIKGYITSGAGFMYEVVIGEMLGIDAGLIDEELKRNINRTAGFYAYYAAHLNREVTLTSSEALFRIIISLNAESEVNTFIDNIKKAFEFGEDEMHAPLKNALLNALRSKSSAIDYIEDIKAKIGSLLGEGVVYSFHTSAGGTFDIQAEVGDSESKRSVSFDVKATRQSTAAGHPIPILKPSDRSIDKWKDDEIKSEYYGILNVLLKDFDISLSYALAPRDDKPLAGGLVSLQVLLKDLNNFIDDSSHELTYFKSRGRKTYGILEMPLDKISRDEFNVTNREPTEEDPLKFADIKRQLSVNDTILVKIKKGTIEKDIKATLEDAINHQEQPPGTEIKDIFKIVLKIPQEGQGLRFHERFINSSAIDRRKRLKDNSEILYKSKYNYFLNQLAGLVKLLRIAKDREKSIAKYFNLEGIVKINITDAIKVIEKIADLQNKDIDDNNSTADEESSLSNYLITKSNNRLLLRNFAKYVEDDIKSVVPKDVDKDPASELFVILQSVNRIYYCLKRENAMGTYFSKDKDNPYPPLQPDPEETSGGVDDSHNISGSPLLEKVVRSLVRNMLQEADKKTYRGSHPEESYGWSAKEEDFMFDKPGLTTWEEDRKWVKQYLKSMGLLGKK